MGDDVDNVDNVDAVFIDGDIFRRVHAEYQECIVTPDWKACYPEVKRSVNFEKRALIARACAERKNLIIPQTCLNISKVLNLVERLSEAGYRNHVLAVSGPRQ